MLHAIFFHRLFGPIKPQTFEVLDVTMVCERLFWNIANYLCVVSLRFRTKKRNNLSRKRSMRFGKESKAGLVNGVRQVKNELLNLQNR